MRRYRCDLGRLLRLYGISQVVIAKELDVGASTISEWCNPELGRVPSVEFYGPILDAVERVGNPEVLKLKPVGGLSDLIVLEDEKKDEKSND